MSMSAKIAGLSVVTLPVVGLTQFHYVVSHLSQIATGAAAITVGAAVWGGHAMIGKVKLRNEERKAAAESSAVDERIARLAEAMEARALHPTQPTQAWEPKRVIDLGRVER